MPTGARRQRERAQRHQLILRAARDLAAREGWDAVTTRRLADRIEYSQGILYSHFHNREAIIQAVAVQGFGELAEQLAHAASQPAHAPTARLSALVDAYVAFADTQPALYEAMFSLDIRLPFGTPDAPPALQAAFAALRDTLTPLAGGRDLDTLAELVWSTLHGLVTLERAGRLRADHQAARLRLLVDQLVGSPPSPSRRSSI